MTEVVVAADPEALADLVAERFLALLVTLQADGRVPAVVLTGGTIADAVHRRIAARATGYAVDWTRVEFWFGDERYVAADSPDRNAGQARSAFLDAVGADRVHEAPAAVPGVEVEDAAATYAAALAAAGTDAFDLVMLGIGPDGHVASLFPGSDQLAATDAAVLGVRDSPKPPPQRITMTFPTLNRSDRIWLLASGSGKAEAVAAALAPDGTIARTPARGVAATDWFLDAAADPRAGR